MPGRVAILQSDYIPWKGYFDIVNSVDDFVLLDEVQYTDHDWRNRNRIKTQHGVQWITIPVAHGGRSMRIDEARIADPKWAERHWRTIRMNYARAAGFERFGPELEDLFRQCAAEEMLVKVNHRLMRAVMGMLGIRTRLHASTAFRTGGDRILRLVDICRQLGATAYLSGPSARDYLDEGAFAAAGIRVEWMDYGGYPEYRQLHPPFEHGVSVVDLLLNEGERAPGFMKSFGGARTGAGGPPAG